MRLAALCLSLLAVPARAEEPAAADLRKLAGSCLAQTEGEVRLAGLREAVEVLRDRWGVPHIYAKNAADLFFAQGFVVAQDRLFQIDWWRRLGAGELAEVIGEQAVEADRFARLIRYRGDMDAEWASYSPDARAIAAAFTRGINACIDHMGDNLPVEFRLLKCRPAKWKPEDVLGRMSGVYMTQNLTREVARAQLVAAAGVEKARWLAPTDPARDFGPAGGLELTGIDQRVLAGYRAATKLLSLLPSTSESNNWVVHGGRSASGKPLLASDPHRAIALPSLRYLVHLNAPGWNVIGSGEPGLPGVAIGHNEWVAWGFTIVGADQTDLVVVNTDPKDPSRYQTDGGWEAMTVVREDVLVKGKGKRPVELRFTRHGPVLFHDAKRGRAFALRWVGSEPGGAAYLASLAVDRATNREEFLAALSRWKVPGLNFVYADTGGNIGWIAAARVPVRKGHDGLLPVPGSEAFGWKGHLALAELPQRFNPREGFVATANHNILPRGYPHAIGYEFAAPYRYRRLSEALAGKEKWRLEDFKALQQDHVSLAARDLTNVLAKVDLGDRELQRRARDLAGWDGSLGVGSREGPLYAVWLKEVKAAMLALHLPNDLQKTGAGIIGLPTMLQALNEADPRWFGKDAKSARDRLVRETFAGAVKKARELPDRWGALHTVTFRHPLGNMNPAYASAFNLGPVERPGDEHCPNNTRYDDSFRQVHGATYRQLIDLADWDRALATSAPGQSGQPGSPHYGDLLPLWAKGEYFPLAFSRKKVEGVTKERLRLLPPAQGD